MINSPGERRKVKTMYQLITFQTTTLCPRNLMNRSHLRRSLPRKQQLPRAQAMWIVRGLLLLMLALGCFAFSPAARAVDPPPDGGYPGENTAEGEDALFSLTSGFLNTAVGFNALYSNTTGYRNTALGFDSLRYNTTGSENTAIGFSALLGNTTGLANTATGAYALQNNTTGSFNIALADNAGFNLTTGSNNIDIGNAGVGGESNTIRIGRGGTQRNTFIAGIYGVTLAQGVGVVVGPNGHLGTVGSSARFKDEIKPMDKASEAILAVEPVTFRYKKELDPDGIPQFGLVAEDVEKVNPDLVARDADGKAYTVRYEAVNAMLLNEFLKEHRKVEQQEVTIAKQQKQIEALTAGLQRVSAQVEMSRPASQMVGNNQ
jgi:hypothetical protein